MSEGAAGLQAEGGALKDGSEKALLVAPQERWGFPELGHHDAGQPVGRQGLRQGHRHLVFEGRAQEHVDDGILAGHALLGRGGRCLLRCGSDGSAELVSGGHSERFL